MDKGKLILFPVSIGGALDWSLPTANGELLNSCHHFVVEELRTARRFLKSAGYLHPIDETEFMELNEHTHREETEHYLDAADKGFNIGLLSEAGLPCIADPGAMVVEAAQQKGLEVVPLVGPSSLMLTLMASGLNGQKFTFNGYLPVERKSREAAIARLERDGLKLGETQLLIEAPYRNNQMMQSLVDVCHDETLICVGCDLMMPSQMVRTRRVADWRKQMPDLHKRNTVFAIGQTAKR